MNHYVKGYTVDEEKFQLLTTVKDVEKVKEQIRIGDLVETQIVEYGFDDARYCTITPRLLPVVRKYTYLAETEDPRTGRRYTVPYKDIAPSRRRVEA